MRRLPFAASLAVFAFALSACTGGQAGGETPPTPAPSVEETEPSVAAPDLADPLPLVDLAAFSGVATMSAGSNCTGTLVDTGVADGPAYVLTNGHCVGDVGRSAQRTTVGEEWWGTAEFFRAEGNLDATLLVDVVELAYSTMRHTDTGIVRLDRTLGELRDLGVTPVAIAENEPTGGTEVTNIGVPVQGLSDEEWVMRRSECTLGAQHTLIEFGWLWFNSWSNDCAGIRQGSSGSPLFTLDDEGLPTAVAAVINTTTAGAPAGGACWLSRPCEVTADGVRVAADTSYAQSAAGIGACFDSVTGEFALGGPCPLPISSVWSEAGGGSFRGADLPDSVGRTPIVALEGHADATARTALVPFGDGSPCLDPATYADAVDAPVTKATGEWIPLDQGEVVELPEVEGHYAYCAVIGEDYAGAATVLFEVDRTPPLLPAGAEVDLTDADNVVVRPDLNPPELSNLRFTWGAPGVVDCEDPEAFQDFFIIPLVISNDDLPAVYCVYAMDEAGNPTPVEEIEIPAR